MICPHCSQWNPSGAARCVFCRNQFEGRLDRTSGAGPPGAFGAHGPQAAPVSGLGGPKESGSPADIARSLKTASFVVSVVLVLLVVLYRSCLSC